MAKPNHGRRQNRHSPFPSQATLAAIALIAAAPPVVACSPLPTQPPDFLCPLIQRDIIYPPSTSTSSPTPTPSTHQHQAVADRYVKGPDNLWRKIPSWTLYGSTCCPGSMTATSSTSQMPTYTPIPTSTPASTTTAFDTSSLPAGWNNSDNTSSTESTTILALAIALAGSICVFMLGCLVWRRRKKRARDIERKLAPKHPVLDNSSGDARDKEPHGKMRAWARASARWKSNIRQSARRRRRRPLASSTANRSPSPTLNDSHVSVGAPSPMSRQSSLPAEELDPSPPAAADDSSTGQVDAQHDPPRPPSPPTYGASFVPRYVNTPSTSAMCNSSSASPPDSAHLSNRPSFIGDEPLPYIPRSDGHVAMDDKSHLARIRELASSPPAPQPSESTMQSVSAPEWHDVEYDLETLSVDLSEVHPVRDFGFPPSFPQPPKANDSFGYLDNIPVSSISGPSGSPSAPPIDYPSLEPSAPSLEDDDLFQDWDAASSYVPDAPTLADQDSTPACATDSSTSPAVPCTSRSSFSSVRPTATRNSILPQYHP